MQRRECVFQGSVLYNLNAKRLGQRNVWGNPMGKKPERLPGGRNFFTDIRQDKVSI